MVFENYVDCITSAMLQVEDVDVMASNGVVHGINRVLFPPPVFKKEDISAGTAKSLAGDEDPEESGLAAPKAIKRKSTSNEGVSG